MVQRQYEVIREQEDSIEDVNNLIKGIPVKFFNYFLLTLSPSAVSPTTPTSPSHINYLDIHLHLHRLVQVENPPLLLVMVDEQRSHIVEVIAD